MKDTTSRTVKASHIHQLLARLHLAIHDYQDSLPDEIHSIPRGHSPCGYPLTLWDDYDWLSVEIASLSSAFDELIELESEAITNEVRNERAC